MSREGTVPAGATQGIKAADLYLGGPWVLGTGALCKSMRTEVIGARKLLRSGGVRRDLKVFFSSLVIQTVVVQVVFPLDSLS